MGAPILSMFGMVKNFIPIDRSTSVLGNDNEFIISKKEQMR